MFKTYQDLVVDKWQTFVLGGKNRGLKIKTGTISDAFLLNLHFVLFNRFKKQREAVCHVKHYDS